MALNTQIKVGADSSGVATGLEPGKRALKDFGASAEGAGKSLSGMGNGSAQSAQKVEQATKSMIQSIQRTTAATEAGDKSTRAYQESLARMRGIDVAALKPYLDQLDAAKSKAAQAATANNSLGDSFAGLSSRSVIAAGAIGAIGAALSAAFSAASIKGVIDVADTFSKLSQKSGVAVEALRELNYAASLSDVSTEALGTGLRKLSQNMASAAGGGKEQAAAFAAIGVSVKGMDGALKGADVVLSEIAGKFANFSDGPEKAALAIELFGKQGADMIPLLNSGTSGLLEMAKEAAELGIVFGSDLAKNAEAFNDNLTRIQTSSEGAKIAIANELLPTLNYLAQAFLDAQKAGSGFGSFIGGALKTIIEAATILYSDVEFVLKGIGREFGAIGAQVVALGKLDIKGFNAISAAVKEDGVRARAELDKFQYDLLNAGILSSKAGAGRGTATDPRLLGSTQATAPIVAAIAATKELREIVNKSAKEDIAAFKVMADLKTKFEGEEIARLEKTREELEKTMEAYAKAAEAGVASAIATATAAEAELSNYGLLKSEVQALGLVQLEQARESAAMAGEDVANIEKRIAAQKRLIAATKGVEVRTASDNAAKEAAAEWKRTADSIQNTLTDALMRGFESGKDFARNLRDTVVNMFKTLVLRPIISAVINPIAGAVSGALGLSGAAQAAGAATSGASAIGAAGTLASLATTAASWGTAAGAGFMATIGGSTIAGGGAAGILATGGAAGAGTAGMIGALGPYALAALAVLAIHDMTQGETRNGAKYGVGSDGKAIKLEGPSGGEIAATQAQAMFNVAKSSIEGMLTGFGSKAVLTGFTAGLESSDNGKGFAYATGQINGKSFGDVNTYMNSRGDKTQEQALKDYQLELTQSILEGLQVTEDIPASIAKLISDGLNGSEVKNLSLEATSAILTNVETLSKQVNTFNTAMTQLPFEKLKNLSFDTAAGLIAAAGGFEKLDANLTSYYANFYSAEEQRAQSITNTEAAFKALGLTMPALDEGARAAYRAMVELAAGQDLSVEANAKAYTGLLSLNGAMNNLAPAIDSVAQSAAEAAATMTSAWANVMQSRGVAANDVTRFTAQASIDAAFTEYKKTDKFGIGSAEQFKTITQADFANYSGADQKLIATILTGFSDLSKAVTSDVGPAASSVYTPNYDTTSYTAEASKALAPLDLLNASLALQATLAEASGDAIAAQTVLDKQRLIVLAGLNEQDPTGGLALLQTAIFSLNDAAREAAKELAITSTRMTWQDKINAITQDPAAIAASRAYAKQRDLASTDDPLTKALIETAYQYEDDVAARKKQTDLMALQDEAMKGWISTQKAVTDAQKAYAGVLKNTISSLKDFLGTLDGAATPGQKVAGARLAFGNLSAQAASGDTSVYDKLAPAAKTFLDLSKNYSRTVQDYQRDEAAVRNSLNSVIAVNQRELDKLPAEISAASDPTKEAWKALKEATDKEALAHILVTAMSVDQITSQARLNGTTKSLETRYLELIASLPTGAGLAKTFWDTMGLAIKTFVPAKEADFSFEDSFVSVLDQSLPKDFFGDKFNISESAAAELRGKIPGMGAAFNLKSITETAISNAINGVIGGVKTAQAAPAQSLTDFYISKLGNTPSGLMTTTEGLSQSAAYAKSQGKTIADLAAIFDQLHGTAGSGNFANSWAKTGLPSFAVGTNYVPQDMTARIHEGEAIIPKAYNPAANTQERDQAVVAEIRALREEVSMLRGEAKAGQNAIAANTRKTAESLDKFDNDGLPATRI